MESKEKRGIPPRRGSEEDVLDWLNDTDTPETQGVTVTKQGVPEAFLIM
jgi:hypothetical protein